MVNCVEHVALFGRLSETVKVTETGAFRSAHPKFLTLGENERESSQLSVLAAAMTLPRTLRPGVATSGRSIV